MNLLENYAQLLYKWNKIHNLSGAKNIADIQKNIDDSLYPKQLLQDARNVLDIGSGAGFPGLILAIAYPKISFVLAEPINKKASFLKTAVRTLGLENVSVATCKAQELEQTFDFILSRAVAPTKTLLEIAKPVSTGDTRYLFYKGDEVTKELEGLDVEYELIHNDKRIYLYIKENRC
ncbi:MAG: 16S rRNA (guanine(527)-N(7))-methyltransferase RsmG [Campylobacterota bacterium]